jgi:predicted Ser/Thr protein kinase
MPLPLELGVTNGGLREFDLPAKGLLDWLTRPTMVGKTVGKYRVLERIGRGGMGIVYKAVDETLDRDVAIKVLNSDFTDGDVLKRFRAEAVTLARLNHPGIATIYELHRQNDELMMVMEFVRGETLHQLSDRIGPLDPPQAAHLCMQVLDALSHAHRAGVIHRDLKPANLMVTEGGVVKVMDFGIARVLGSEHFTMGGLMMGTPAFMSPEQVTGQPIDARADLYAIGVIFYRLVSGRLPFIADTAIAMVQKQISDQPTPLAEVRQDLPAWCTTVVERALAKDPAQRFQSAEEFRGALTAAVVPQNLGELPTLATPTLGTVFPSTALSRGATLESDATALPTPGHRHTTGTTVVLGGTHLLALAALFVVLTAGIVVLAMAAFRGATSSSPNTPPPAASGAPAAQPPADQKTEPPVTDLKPTVPQDAPAPPARGSTPPGARGPNRADRAPSRTPPSPPAAPAPVVAGTKPVDTPPPPTAAPPPAAPAAAEALPVVAFGDVKVLVMDADRLRERAGVLRVGNGEVAIAEANGSRVLTSLDAITSLHFSRSKQPRWRDANGKEVETRVDLGRFGVFRSDRNWLILVTSGEPIILSIDNAQVRPVGQALQARTGLTVQRFQ